VNFSESTLASLDQQLKGSCNIERINQYIDGDLISINQPGHLHVEGWNLIAGQEITADVESYVTLITERGKPAFTTRIQQRVPRADVAEYHKLSEAEGLLSGVRSHASLQSVKPGKYKIGIDTKIGPACLRALSTRAVVIDGH
jgi:hypothetical protein